jgi:hypothetical protein
VLFRCRLFDQLVRDFTKLFEDWFEVLDDFLGENVGIGKVVGIFEAFASEPKDADAGFVAG